MKTCKSLMKTCKSLMKTCKSFLRTCPQSLEPLLFAYMNYVCRWITRPSFRHLDTIFIRGACTLYVQAPLINIVYVQAPLINIVYVQAPLINIVYVQTPLINIVYVQTPLINIVYDKHRIQRSKNGLIFYLDVHT